ncbi:TlpA disulfide reductase family protein [uncultured Draconibacterium sp.]|uniref:TlpA family protein disulfide reductase n=1 Tax=uncultured Draconibacterium sp. TaxID=1573823 RepID=UPI0029C0A612|nr:TlpA disulfide reductase family protein [uncultured Draconibacterium sp.]
MHKYLFILLLALISTTAFSQEKKEIDFAAFDKTKVGDKVPDFSFKTIDGKSYKISELEGKTVMLVFFATWCGPCMKELPRIETEIWEKYKSDDFMVVALGRDHSMEEIEKFNANKGFTFPIGPDPEHKIYGLFFEKYIPRNVLINKEGKIIYQKQGYRDEDVKNLKSLLEEQIM